MNIKQDKTDVYSSILVIVIGGIILSRYFKAEWLFHTSLIIGVLALVSRKIAEYIVYAWFLLAKGLGYIVPNIVMALVFYLLLTPIAWLSRVFASKDPLILKNRLSSTFKKRTMMLEKSSFEKPW